MRCKIIVAGDATVGKTSLTQMFQSKGTVYPKNYKMTGSCDVHVVPVHIPDTATTAELFICDVGGQDVFRDHVAQVCNGFGAIMLVYDSTNQKSFDNLPMWLELLKKQRPFKEKPIQGATLQTSSTRCALRLVA
ncbi:hypothetical protein CYMTET_7636 [Cymbomonas tetramitiformis]|uniref:Uncharacterized protein n=1 Tax=Cymbomonas tetramitiformis TaxID=36881 RepID=A0AAE0GV28_9CHLO|nr:hypothetical protein CYMTET_7636 [Cymbomonas tetramitiformis]